MKKLICLCALALFVSTFGIGCGGSEGGGKSVKTDAAGPIPSQKPKDPKEEQEWREKAGKPKDDMPMMPPKK